MAKKLKEISPKYNNGKPINVVSQRLGYLVRSGAPDCLDSIVPIAFANIAFDLISRGEGGRLVSIRDGRYGDVPLDIIEGEKKAVDVSKYYNQERYRPLYTGFAGKPLLIMTADH